MRHYDSYPEYVPVAQRRAKAQKKLTQLRKKQPNIRPVVITGQTLATTWWGKSWNSNLERYADYSNRIGRGRSYARHGSVLDLQLTPAKITALVQGSRSQPYTIVIKIDKLSPSNWAAIRQACKGSFDSLSELLAGKFPQALKDLFFEKGAGLFPSPRDIHFDCSCPDWASMCKHIAATLYGVGARLDEDPSLFFTLRGIDIDDIISETVAETAQTLLGKAKSQSENILQDVDLGDVFGIQLDNVETPLPDLPPVQPRKSTAKKPATKAHTTVAGKKSTQASKTSAKKRIIKPPQRTLAALKADKTLTTASSKRKKIAVVAPPNLQKGTMLDTLLKAVGKARKGKSVQQLQDKLSWTKTQVRNAISRADTKGLVEAVNPGIYRQKI